MRICALFLVLSLSGCGWTFGLPGHNSGNFDHPPDLVLHVGQRISAVKDCLALGVERTTQGFLTSEDPKIVSVEYPSGSSAVLVARAIGSTRLFYYAKDWNTISDKPNQGFEVTVLP